MSQTQHMIPVTVLTGFLGAGKTTLLNRILSEQHGQKIAVIENEFGPESIDNDLLVRESNEQIIEMNNGCICCTVRGDLVNALIDLSRKRAAGDIHFDRVIIETTGMADPGPVCQTFFMDETVEKTYMLDAVITVVDAKHGMQTLDAQKEAQNQIGFADVLLVSKVDLVSDKEFDVLKKRIVRMNPRAKVQTVHFGSADLKEILDIRGFNLNAILEIDPDFLPEKEAHGHHDHHDHHDHCHDEHCTHEHHHCHDEHCDHEHHALHDDAIKAFVFKSDRPFDPMKLEDFLGGVVQIYGADMLRYKGILYMKGAKSRMLFQGVHMLMGADVGPLWKTGEKKSTKMVFIGRNLPEEIFLKGLEQCLVS